MRIATFNVENLDLPLGPRAAVLRPALERLEADILCLQEVNGQHVPGRRERELKALDALLAGTRYADYQRAATHPPGRDGVADVHNLVTLSRFPIVEHRQVLHEICPPMTAELVTATPRSEASQGVRFERPLLITSHDLGRERLHVVNVHLRAPLASPVPGGKSAPFVWTSVAAWAEGYWLSGLKRLGQALELRLAVEALFEAEPQPLLLVTGDFNSEEGDDPLRLLIGAVEDTGNRELASRSLVLIDRAIDPDRRFSVLHHGRPQMVDHMLASHRLYGRFRSIEVHNEALGDEVVGYAKGIEAAGSYHAAVVATFAG